MERYVKRFCIALVVAFGILFGPLENRSRSYSVFYSLKAKTLRLIGDKTAARSASYHELRWRIEHQEAAVLREKKELLKTRERIEKVALMRLKQ